MTRINAVSADPDAVRVTAETLSETTVLDARGRLDSSSYRRLRDAVIKAALEDALAVVVDVTHLEVPAESAWSVFTSVRWHVNRWPEVPILLVCAHPVGRRTIARNGVSRYVPVYATRDAALAALAAAPRPRYRRRVRAKMPAGAAGLPLARKFVSDTLTAWSQPEFVVVAKVVVTTFIENVLVHTVSQPSVRLESDGRTVTVAVEDANFDLPALREDQTATVAPSGLGTVAMLVRAWGAAPTPTGKTVWAVLGPENAL